MPKIAYSKEERERIRAELLQTGLDLMAKQGVQHTTVEQIYRKVGISRTFFYSFFPAKVGFDCGSSLSSAAQGDPICTDADGRPWPELEGRSQEVSLFLLLWGEKWHCCFEY